MKKTFRGRSGAGCATLDALVRRGKSAAFAPRRSLIFETLCNTPNPRRVRRKKKNDFGARDRRHPGMSITNLSIQNGSSSREIARNCRQVWRSRTFEPDPFSVLWLRRSSAASLIGRRGWCFVEYDLRTILILSSHTLSIPYARPTMTGRVSRHALRSHPFFFAENRRGALRAPHGAANDRSPLG